MGNEEDRYLGEGAEVDAGMVDRNLRRVTQGILLELSGAGPEKKIRVM